MSIKNLPTLKGVFPHPKPLPKRDFIKENKLKIRTDQKCTTERKSNIANNERNAKPHSQHLRENSAGVKPSNRISSACTCTAKKSFSAAKCAKLKYPKEPLKCDKSMQTDDIVDEAFLADALSRIVTQDLHQNNDDKDRTTYPLESSSNAKATQCTNSVETNNLAIDLSKSNDDNQMSETQELILRKSNVGGDFQKSNTKGKAQSISSHRSELRTRREIRIPNYLEREKREKELQRIKEMEKDPHCPEGHYVLSEEDRKASLSAAENLFRDLVNELNRMPMSSETLRIRNRKMEIEKALMDLEKTIRKFSKPKVYVRADN